MATWIGERRLKVSGLKDDGWTAELEPYYVETPTLFMTNSIGALRPVDIINLLSASLKGESFTVRVQEYRRVRTGGFSLFIPDGAPSRRGTLTVEYFNCYLTRFAGAV